MWDTSGRLFLQVGLGRLGTEIARHAKSVGFTVWGLQDPPSFHPHCQKVLSSTSLKSVLPEVDVLSLALPRDKPFPSVLGEKELTLMKNDSILTVIGLGSVLNLQDLENLAKTGKWRGVLLDAHFTSSFSENSPLRSLPQVIVTPEVGSYPQEKGTRTLGVFMFNLRQYMHGNISDMKNLHRTTTGFDELYYDKLFTSSIDEE
jgi:phosphoglycerate dehydrogenase-like enzyme